MCLHRAVLHTKNRLFFYVLDARGDLSCSAWDIAILGLIVFYIIHLLLLCNDYLNDSDFLSLFFELFTGYEAIMVIICRKYELLK